MNLMNIVQEVGRAYCCLFFGIDSGFTSLTLLHPFDWVFFFLVFFPIRLNTGTESEKTEMKKKVSIDLVCKI